VQYLCSQNTLAKEICKLTTIIKDLNASIIPLMEMIILLQSSTKAVPTVQMSASQQMTTTNASKLIIYQKPESNT